MPKRIKFLFVSLFTVLVFIMTACSVAPFNTEADLDYNVEGMAYEVELGGELQIPVVNENGVEAKAKEVKIDVYENGVKKGSTITITRNTEKGTIISEKISGNSSGVIIVSLEGLDLVEGQEIKVVDVEFEDLNGNDIKLGKIIKAIEVTSSTGTGGGSSTDSLSPVSGLTATVNGTTVTLKWAEHANAMVGYRVYKMESENGIYDSSLEQEIVVANGVTTSQTEYQDKNLTDGYTYFYKVTAYSGTKETPKQSIAVNKTIEEEIVDVVIPAPQNVVGESDIDQATITWDEVTISAAEIIGYNIYIVEKAGTINEKAYKLNEFPGREDLTEEERASVPNITKATTFTLYKGYKYGTDKEITTGVDYHIRVKAVRGDNLLEGKKSNSTKVYLYNGNAPVIVNNTEFSVVPKSSIDADAGDSLSTVGAKLRWPDKPEVIQYIIERAEASEGPYETLTTIDEGVDSPNFKTDDENGQNWYIDGSFSEVPGKSAYYKIRCVTAEGIGKLSGYVQMKDTGAPSVPIVSTEASYLMVENFDEGRLKPTFGLFDMSDEEDIEYAEVPDEQERTGYKIYIGKIKQEGNNEEPINLIHMGIVTDLRPFTIDLTQDYNGTPTNFEAGKYCIRVTSINWFGNESSHSSAREFYVY